MKIIIDWYIQNVIAINLVKDVVFFISAISIVVGAYHILIAFSLSKIKCREMENDKKKYLDIREKLSEYVNRSGENEIKNHDIEVKLLKIKNYPHNLSKDGYGKSLFCYRQTPAHEITGYISSSGIFLIYGIYYMEGSIYYDAIREKWFLSKGGEKHRKYIELKDKYLIVKIPFSNIVGYNFDSDWGEERVPIFYTKYKYNNWKLFANELVAVNQKDGKYPYDVINLRKQKMAKHMIMLAHMKKKMNAIFAYKISKGGYAAQEHLTSRDGCLK